MELTHLNERGEAIMVDVSSKAETDRSATAAGKIFVGNEIFKAIVEGGVPKGDVLSVARIAAIMAVKRTSEIIPLCHPLPIASCSVDFNMLEEDRAIEARVTVKVRGVTGVEMEALHGVAVALLTIYDMCKAIDKGMRLDDIRLLKKSGGKSGEFVAQ